MNVTYLIGNGFDLHLGMRTSFKDICEAYVKEKTDNEIINKFKIVLKKDSPEYKNWSDFEIAMGAYSENYDKFEDFKLCVHSFRSFMVNYLRKEEKRYTDFLDQYQIPNYKFNVLLSNLCDSIYFSPKKAVVEDLKQRGIINESFISFNYTAILDKMIYSYNHSGNNTKKYSNVIHIHNDLNGSILFGVDNEEQIANANFRGDKRKNRTFIKPFINNEMDYNKVNNVINTIWNSEVICVYGMSFGDSDLTWKNEVFNWLKANDSHILVYFDYNDLSFEKHDSDDILNLEDDLKISLLEKMGCTENYDDFMEQIIIPINEDLIDFTEYVTENFQTKESLNKRPIENAVK